MITVEIFERDKKFVLVIDGKVVSDSYVSASKAAEKAYKYLKGQGR